MSEVSLRFTCQHVRHAPPQWVTRPHGCHPPPTGYAHTERPDPTGVPYLQENTSPQDPTVGPCLGPYGGPRGGGNFLMGEVPL